MTRKPTERNKRDKSKTSSFQEPQKVDHGVTIAVITQIAVVIVAVIGCVATVLAAFMDSPIIPDLLPFTHVSSPTLPTPTQTLPFLPTDTPFLTMLSVPTEIPPTPTSVSTVPLPIISPLPTAEAVVSKLIAILSASMVEGKSPLPVNFNARDSYVQFADGSVATCGTTNFCTFTWAIYRDQKRVISPFQGQGTFSYTFPGKGVYSVTVYVCRANVCADDGVVVTVR